MAEPRAIKGKTNRTRIILCCLVRIFFKKCGYVNILYLYYLMFMVPNLHRPFLDSLLYLDELCWFYMTPLTSPQIRCPIAQQCFCSWPYSVEVLELLPSQFCSLHQPLFSPSLSTLFSLLQRNQRHGVYGLVLLRSFHFLSYYYIWLIVILWLFHLNAIETSFQGAHPGSESLYSQSMPQNKNKIQLEKHWVSTLSLRRAPEAGRNARTPLEKPCRDQGYGGAHMILMQPTECKSPSLARMKPGSFSRRNSSPCSLRHALTRVSVQ